MLQKNIIRRNQPEGTKKRYFRLFHILLRHYQVPHHIYYLFLIIELLQMTYYACHCSFQSMWPHSPLSQIQVVLDYIDLSTVWRSTSGTPLIAFVAVALSVNILIAAIVLYEINKDQTKLEDQNVFRIRMLTYYFVVVKTVLVVPTTLALVAFLSPDLYNLSVHQVLLKAVLSVLLAFVFTFNSILALLFFRANSPFSPLPFSSPVNYIEELRLFIKVVLGIYGSAARKDGSGSFFFAWLYFSLLLCALYLMRSRPGFSRLSCRRLYELGFIYPLWTLSAALLQMYLSKEQSTGFNLWIVGLLLIPFSWDHLQKTRITQILTAPYKQLPTLNQFIEHNFQCSLLAINSSNNQNLIQLYSIISLHLKSCNDHPQDCVCTRIHNNILSRTLNQSQEPQIEENRLWFQLIRNNLQYLVEKHDSCPEVRLLLAYIENEVFENKLASYHHLQLLRKSPGIRYQMLAYDYTRIIETKMLEEDTAKNLKKPVDVNRFLRFELLLSEEQKLIEESAHKHTEFWKMLKSKQVTVHSLYTEGLTINRLFEKIEANYEQLISINRNNIQTLVLYANYLKVIVSLPQLYELSQDNIRKVKRTMLHYCYNIQNQIQKEKYGANSISTVIIVSGEKKSLGLIKHCTSKITQVSGYTSDQLLGHHINIFMPKFIASKHDELMQNYFEKAQHEQDYKQREIPMLDIQNYLQLVRILIKPMPHLINGLEIVGIFNTILETSPSHPGETPKYLLYRTDSGEVQALSKSCDTQFQYRFHSIDEYHEACFDFNFCTLFPGVKGEDLNSGQKIKCDFIIKNISTSEFSRQQVQLFQRASIHHKQTELKLLCFYTLQNYRDVETIKEEFHEEPEEILLKEVDLNKMERSQVEPQKMAREKFLRDNLKKKPVLRDMPVALKSLVILGVVAMIGTLTMAITFSASYDINVELEDYLSIYSENSKVIQNICELAFYSRLKQLYVFYSAYLPPESQISQHIQSHAISMKQFQINVDTKYLKYQALENFILESYSYEAYRQVSSSLKTMSAQIYDIVTTSNAIKRTPLSIYNFSLRILQETNPKGGTGLLFTIRYNTLFQILPTQATFIQHLNQLFQTLFQGIIRKAQLQLSIVLAIMAILLLTAICLAYSADSMIERTLLVFKNIKYADLDFEIENCNRFLDIFYHDSYQVILKHRTKAEQGTFLDEQTQSQAISKLKTFKSSIFSNQMDNLSNHSSARMTINTLQYMEKELGQILTRKVQIYHQEKENENHMLRGEHSEDIATIYSQLKQDHKGIKNKVITLFAGLFLLMISYFIGEYLVFTYNTHRILAKIETLRLAYNSINYLKLMRLYGLETYIDNSTFLSYPTPSSYLNSVYSQLYDNQRHLYSFLDRIEPDAFPFIYANVCSLALIVQLRRSVNLGLNAPDSFSSAECSYILATSLTSGVRFAAVAYAESFLNISRLNISETELQATNLRELMYAQKYFLTPLRDFISKLEKEIREMIAQKDFILWLACGLFMGLAALCYCAVWLKALRILHERLVSSRTTLGLITERMLARNSMLTKDYQEYFQDFVEQ